MNDRLEIALIREERKAQGLCPCCGMRVCNWKKPDRSTDTWQMFEDRGINPRTGHADGCQEG